jgi:transcriptional regulator with XRE-family HTH domain
MINTTHLILMRYSKGLSQRELGDKIGKNKDTIYRYENGKIIPTIQSLKEWCEAVGANPNEAIKWG